MKKFLLISILLTPGVVFGKTISGTVVDENGDPLPYAHVVATNQPGTGKATDLDGKFVIDDFPTSEQKISISFMGFKTQQKQASECTLQNPCTIQLEAGSTKLEGVDIVASPICGTDEVNAKYHATQTKLLKKQDGSTYCAPANKNSCANFYKYENGQCVSIDGDNCFDTQKHETSGKWECQTDENGNNTACSCKNKKCDSGYKLNDSGTSCEKITIDCTRFLNELNATAAKQKTTSLATQDTPEQDLYKYCYPTECNAESGYTINGSGEKAVCVKVTGNDCTSQITGATKATLEYDAQKKQIICKVSKCDDRLYFTDPQNNKCKNKDGAECDSKDTYADNAEYECVENTCSCKIQTCKTGYTPSIDGKSCVEKKCECGQIWDKNKRQCIKDSRNGKDCPNANKGIKSGTYQCVDDEMTCIVTKCSDGYKLDGFLGNDETKPTKCIFIQGDDCTTEFSTTPNAVTAKYKKVNNKLQCVITRCKDNYTPSDDGKTCEQTEGDCPNDSLPDHASAGKLHKGICKATECVDGYMVESGKCVELSGACKPTDPNAKSGHLKYDTTNNAEICIIDTCKTGYTPSIDGKSCVEKKCECGQIWDKNERKCIEDSRAGKACPNTNKGIKSGTYQCVDDEMTCIVTKCSDGYKLDVSGTSCEKITIDCAKFLNKLNATAAKQKTTSLATQDTPEQDLYKYCYPTECNAESGYTINGSGEDATCVKVTGNDCTSQITGASKATLTYDAQKKRIICKVSECEANLYLKEPQNNTCKSKDGTECYIKDDHLERAEYECVEDTCTCKIQKCTKGYTPSIDGESCVEKKCECGKIWDKNERKCIEDSRAGKACPNTNKGIESGTYQCVDNGEMTCIVTECSDGYKPDGFLGNGKTLPTKCVSIQGDDCIEQFRDSDSNAVIAKYKKVNNKLKCVITKCEKDYTPSDNGQKCERTEGDCPTGQLPQYATEGKLHRGKCKATECKPGYMVESGECVELSGSCKPDDDPNAKSGHLTYDEKENQEICVIDSCKKYYEVQDGKCVLSNAHSEEELKEKSDNVNKLRDNEQSLANRMTSAVSMGATGIGGMMLAQSLSEQRVDKESEQDMDAYLATFRCEYAGGNPVPGGTIGTQLPADKLFDLYQEYVTLAADVQEAKSQLGLKPGIESEVVLDKANIGLYDDTSTGTTNGTYASLYRALSDSSSMDAQKWNDQKAQTNKNLKIGIGVVAGGAALGEAGNILTNHIDWDNSEAPNMFKEGLKSIGMINVDKLKLNNIDWGKIDVSKIDFSKLASLKGKDASTNINTTNQTSFEKSLKQLGILQ